MLTSSELLASIVTVEPHTTGTVLSLTRSAAVARDAGGGRPTACGVNATPNHTAKNMPAAC